MGLFNILFGEDKTVKKKTPIEAENERHKSQVEIYQREIDGAKEQIENLKKEIEHMKKDPRGTSYMKSFIDNAKKRIEDHKRKIDSRKKDLERENDQHKRNMEYLRKK